VFTIASKYFSFHCEKLEYDELAELFAMEGNGKRILETALLRRAQGLIFNFRRYYSCTSHSGREAAFAADGPRGHSGRGFAGENHIGRARAQFRS
jgi:hypothetical protein